MKHVNITVRGKVQGVYFRFSTKAVADQLGVKGFVQNRPDGSVYMEAEADSFAIDSLLDWCKEGPEDAEVKELEWTEGDITGFTNFVISKKSKF